MDNADSNVRRIIRWFKTYTTMSSGRLVALLLNALYKWLANTGVLIRLFPALKVRTKMSAVGGSEGDAIFYEIGESVILRRLGRYLSKIPVFMGILCYFS